ncbi:uncharacterized protein N7503_006317 [Penicillium pulvis]|uniref:uncharacterized protein n=1 Tax=Penicillium pulvis TaxID=1562058 RepID=UPI002546FB01|nr:uncharacterized protein N7503_006317 [Penicillium pulvis]KAJ5798812.1 hypothetical protein N7503_006317 [Penicillium pulvis]
MSDATFHTTREDLRKGESKVAQSHGGKVPADSDISLMKSVIDQNTDKSKQIDEAQSNLPLPEQPPVASDWQSADQRTVNVGSGGVSGSISKDPNSGLEGSTTAQSSARVDGSELHKNTAPGNAGRQAVEGLDHLPSDATSR